MSESSDLTKNQSNNTSPVCNLKHDEEEARGTELAMTSPDLDTNSFKLSDDDEEAPENDGIVFLNIKGYKGKTCEGQFHGEGVAFYEGGHTYKGTFSKGLMHGLGVFTIANGLKYEGEFVCNTIMGQGTYTWPDGSTYIGEVNNGMGHGEGTYTCAKNGLLYSGQWRKGKWHGKGTVYYNKDQTSWYKGDWVMNSRDGWGERCYPSGNIYSGEWRKNNRHGEGTMRWLKLGQQYVGRWKDGVQHGQGTHVWFLMHTDRSQYFQSNSYKGEFCQGQRHGEGTFYYAGGAIYKGEWKNNIKHGQGKFTFKDGRVCEAEFIDDQMMIPNLNGDRAPTPLGAYPLSYAPILGPDMALNIERLNIERLLEKFPEKKRASEHKQVEFVVQQNYMELRSIYSFYSRLGHSHSPDNTFLLSYLQFWRLIKDCGIHQHGFTLQHISHIVREEAHSAKNLCPFTTMLLDELLSNLVILAFHIYNKDMMSQKNILATCLSKLMTINILPNAKNVTGILFKKPDVASVAMKYVKSCWDVYQTFSRVCTGCRDEKTMTCRHLLWMFKDLCLLDDNFTTARLLEIIAAESGDPSNATSCLDIEVTFLEFFEILLGCAEVKCKQVSDILEDQALHRRDDQSMRKQPEMEQDGSTPQDVKSQHIWTEENKTPKSPEGSRHEGKGAQCSGMAAKDPEVDLKTRIVQFFHFFFLPAFNHHQLVTRKMIPQEAVVYLQ